MSTFFQNNNAFRLFMFLFAHNNWTKILRELLFPFYPSTDKLNSLPSFRTRGLAKKLSANCCISASLTLSVIAITSNINTSFHVESWIIESLQEKNIVKWHGGKENFFFWSWYRHCHTYQPITFSCTPKLKFASLTWCEMTSGNTTWGEFDLGRN